LGAIAGQPRDPFEHPVQIDLGFLLLIERNGLGVDEGVYYLFQVIPARAQLVRHSFASCTFPRLRCVPRHGADLAAQNKARGKDRDGVALPTSSRLQPRDPFEDGVQVDLGFGLRSSGQALSVDELVDRLFKLPPAAAKFCKFVAHYGVPLRDRISSTLTRIVCWLSLLA
jgi:hypothetical protein